MNTLKIATLASILLAAPAASAADWDLDAAHTDVSFKVRHLAVSYTKGEFNALRGRLSLDEGKPEMGRVEIEVDVSSIDTDNEKRDNHLRSPDFFDTKKFPKMTFVSTKIRRAKSGFEVDGRLTLHGVTKPITLEVKDVSPTVKGPYGFLRKGFTATAKLDRRAFGLKWSKTLETGGLVVGNDVFISIEAEFMRKPGKEDS